METEEAGGQDGGHLGSAVIRGQRGGVEVGSHGRLLKSALSDVRWTVGRLTGGWLAVKKPLSDTFAVRVRNDAVGFERNRVVNSWGVVNPRLREFWAENFGVRKEPIGFPSDPENSHSKRRVSTPGQSWRKCPEERQKRGHPRVVYSRVSALTPLSHLSVAGVVSSPSRTRTYNKPVNSRLLYH